jgi:hypothetical protein
VHRVLDVAFREDDSRVRDYTAHAIWPWCARSRSTSSAATGPARPVCAPDARGLPGTTSTCSGSWPEVRIPSRSRDAFHALPLRSQWSRRHPGRCGSSSRSRIPVVIRESHDQDREGAGRYERCQPSNRSRTLSAQVPGEVLVHLEHGHLVLAEDALELVVGQDLTAVLGVLQVVGLDVTPTMDKG